MAKVYHIRGGEILGVIMHREAPLQDELVGSCYNLQYRTLAQSIHRQDTQQRSGAHLFPAGFALDENTIVIAGNDASGVRAASIYHDYFSKLRNGSHTSQGFG